jgi:membrane associated rhomboid family serine protease
MFLPLGTTAHDGEVRYGAIAIVVICLLVHAMVSRDLANFTSKLEQLDEEILADEVDSRINRQFKRATGDVIPDARTEAEIKASIEAIQKKVQDLRSQTLQYKLALVQGDFNPINLLTSIFTHGDWMHLLFNMWFFWIVGVSMEKYWRMGRFFLVYFASGVVGSLVFMAINQEKGIPLLGASGAIAGMMGAFGATHGDSKIKVFYLLGLKPGTFHIATSWYIGFWFVGQLVDAILHADQVGGVAYSAHIGGFLTGFVAGKAIKPDIFYKKTYRPDYVAPDWETFDKEQEKKKALEEAAKQPQYQDGSAVEALVEKAHLAMKRGEYPLSGELFFQSVEKAFHIPNLAPNQMEWALKQALQASTAVPLPVGSIYSWARRMEQREWWPWAIQLYDMASQEPQSESNFHSRRTSYFRAACLRWEHRIEMERGRAALEAIAQSGESDPLVIEAKEKLLSMAM